MVATTFREITAQHNATSDLYFYITIGLFVFVMFLLILIVLFWDR